MTSPPQPAWHPERCPPGAPAPRGLRDQVPSRGAGCWGHGLTSGAVVRRRGCHGPGQAATPVPAATERITARIP